MSRCGEFSRGLPQIDPIPITTSRSNESVNNVSISQELSTATQSLSATSSVLCLFVQSGFIYAGTQSGEILSWSLKNYIPGPVFRGHEGNILALIAHPIHKEQQLMSASADHTLRVWQRETGQALFVIQVSPDTGALLSLVSDGVSHLFFGCRDTSIHIMNVTQFSQSSTTPVRRRSVSAVTPARLFFKSTPMNIEAAPSSVAPIEIAAETVSQSFPFVHYGAVYCLLWMPCPLIGVTNAANVLVSGSGDGQVKMHSFEDKENTLTCLHTFTAAKDSAVYCFATIRGLLLAGLQGGNVIVWDLETLQSIRILEHGHDIMAMHMTAPRGGQELLCIATVGGAIHIYDSEFRSAIEGGSQFQQRPVFALTSNNHCLIAGGADASVKIMKLTEVEADFSGQPAIKATDTLIDSLTAWIALPSVSGDVRYLESCRRGAQFLVSWLRSHGAEAKMVPGAQGCNPLVFARFKAMPPAARRNSFGSGTLLAESEKTPKVNNILFYGHYDVQPSGQMDAWQSPPFQLTGRDGHLYGRGVTDNKGPIMAFLTAVLQLQKEGALLADVHLLIEGEEESRSLGLAQALQQHASFFGEPNVIVLSNSYWLDDTRPCLTYGLRGVIHATIQVATQQGLDRHAGVHGGCHPEPLQDLIKVLAGLADSEGKVLVPGFHDQVRPVTEAEYQLYRELESSIASSSDEPLSTSAKKLMARWRFPSLTVHSVNATGSGNRTVIPSSASAAVSMRIVPDQSLEQVASHFVEHVEHLFSQLKSPHEMKVQILHKADYWLADIEHSYYKAAAEAIEQVWGVTPLFIREGGSIPAVGLLEQTFKAPVVHIPIGQSSDNAHLPNERIRLLNLTNGVKVLKEFLARLMQLS